MAFKKTIKKNAYGVEVEIPNAYHKIVNITGNKESIVATLGIYSSEQKDLIETFHFSFSPNADENAERWDKQAYLYAKNLAQFSDAIDC